jgi:GAF domain-containing protein
VLNDVMTHPGTQVDVLGKVRVQATVMLPLMGARGVLGVLALARSVDAPPFEPREVAALEDFAHRAGSLIDAERTDQLRRSASALEHRMRDVMGFRDHVITEIFEVIQALTFKRELHPDQELRARLEAIMSELRRAEFSVAG